MVDPRKCLEEQVNRLMRERDQAREENRRMKKHEAEWRDCIERLATAGYRLMQLAGGAEVAKGDILFVCKEGSFSEEIAQQRIRALLAKAKAWESLE